MIFLRRGAFFHCDGGDYGEKGGKFSESEAKFRDISSVLPKGDVARVIGPLAPVHLSAFTSI